MSAPFPSRPRLADHVLVRRHFVTRDDETEPQETIVLHDTRTSEVLRFSARVLGLLAAADGTRDVDGIALAAARAGVLHRRSELRGMLDELHARGLLVDGIDAPVAAEVAVETTVAPDRPLRALPDFALVCDGSGAFCRQYSSIAFTAAEALRARTFVPIVRGGLVPPDRVFLPLAGLTPPGPAPHAHAVAMVDGACAFLDDGRCAIHAVGGLEAKPRPCAVYPATFVDDGESIRVSIKVECSCVVKSLAVHTSGSPGAALLPANVRGAADLDDAVQVRALPARIPLDRNGATWTRAAYVAWSEAFYARISGSPDIARTFVSEAAALAPGADEKLVPLVAAFHARALSSADTADEWRGTNDVARIGRRRVADAAKLLVDRLRGDARGLPPPTQPDVEAFYGRAAIFGHHLVGDGPRTLVDALVDRAVRVLVARMMPSGLAPDARETLPLVEAMVRGHGLERYVDDG